MSFKCLSIAPTNLVNLITLTTKTDLQESKIAWKAGRIERNLLILQLIVQLRQWNTWCLSNKNMQYCDMFGLVYGLCVLCFVFKISKVSL